MFNLTFIKLFLVKLVNVLPTNLAVPWPSSSTLPRRLPGVVDHMSPLRSTCSSVASVVAYPVESGWMYRSQNHSLLVHKRQVWPKPVVTALELILVRQVLEQGQELLELHQQCATSVELGPDHGCPLENEF